MTFVDGVGDVGAVFFDVQGTLADFYVPVTDALATELPDLSADRRAALLVRWRQYWTQNTSAGDMSWRSSRSVYADGLTATSDEFNLRLSDEAKERLVHSWTALQPWNDTTCGLKRLRAQGMIIGALSNADTDVMIHLARNYGWHWDVVVTAQLVGHFKPHPDTYRTAIDSSGTTADQCVLVASHPYDLHAAAKAGMRTVYIHRPLEFGGTTTPERPTPGTFDLIIDDLAELIP
ncbi:haloacid dehalogenase type II [Mycobacteroides abscessus]|nr:haloacid dehalogenase type II [Mycobacteroides abscessus]MDM2427131.1 haloacid dehalogenase type II [Mycobacteroides abscessus]MDM2432202.1 haloacid dehalogenase type II [Mycobacteroides abscessus]MDM2436719.1 haloacid dehalogenase type II [Mycobacteroides abscessus]MDM2438671.1 haloacid dehalogenase type II [Mycobacteroides abscessus]